MKRTVLISVILAVIFICRGLIPVINGEDNTPVTGQVEFYQLSEITKSAKKPIKILTHLQIIDNKPVTTCDNYLIGTIKDGLKIILIDANKNKSYDDFGIDIMLLGDSSYGIPLSKILNIKNNLYDFKIDTEQRKVSLKPCEGPIGYVDFVSQYKSSSPLSLIIITSNNDAYFNAANNNSFAVPCGTYSLFLGYFEGKNRHFAINGNNKNVWISGVLAEGNMTKTEVKESPSSTDKNIAVVKWGAPLRIGIALDVRTQTLKNKPTQLQIPYLLKIFGSANEEYYDFVPELSPSIEIKDNKGELTVKGIFPYCHW